MREIETKGKLFCDIPNRIFRAHVPFPLRFLPVHITHRHDVALKHRDGIIERMTTLTYSAAEIGLAKAISAVRRDRAPIAIHQKAGDVVMMCLEDYQAWEETVYLLRSPKMPNV